MTHRATKAPGRALIIGGSIGGLFAGHLLLRQGWQVDIYERSATELTARGVGIVAPPELQRLLAVNDLAADSEQGVQVGHRILLDQFGAVTHERVSTQDALSWNWLFRKLRDAFPNDRYHVGRCLTGIAHQDRGVTAHFAAGDSQAGDILVGADGFRSTARQLLTGSTQPVYSGYVAWRGIVEEQRFPAGLSGFFEKFAFYLPPGEQILGYPIPGPDGEVLPGGRSYNFVWYRPADTADALPRLLTDDSGRLHVMSIPPPNVAQGVVADMRGAAGRLLPTLFRSVVAQAEAPFLQPIYDLEVPAMAFGNAVLLGDAAFVARPHAVAGVTKAALDAVSLAACLARGLDDIPAVLRQYDAERVPFGRQIVGRARALGSSVRSRFETQEQRAQTDHYREPNVVLSEMASMEFLAERDSN